MTIPASQLVDITPRVIGGGVTGMTFAGTFISKNADLPVGTAVPFYSQGAVGDYFGTDSDEYKLAVNYFLADSNSTRKPQVLWFYKKVDSAAAAFVRGTEPVSLAQLQAVTNGSFAVTVNGTVEDAVSLDFSSAVSYSDIATVISNALSGATCSWNSHFGAFVLTSSTAGDSSSISFAGPSDASGAGEDVSALLGLTAGTSSKGSDEKSLTDTMAGCFNSNSNFYSFMPVWEETQLESLELAAWCNSKGVRFLYPALDKDANALIANSQVCLAHLVRTYNGVACNYNSKAVCAFDMGVNAAIDPEQTEGRRTLAFKSQNGLEPTVTDETNAQVLLANGYNFYGAYATASNEFINYQNGQISGDAKWQDTYYGQVWLRDGLQNSWMSALANASTVPYNDAGYTFLAAAAMDVINTAIRAGFIRQGVTLSNAQRSQVMQEAGLDIGDTLQSQGWYLQILDPSVSVRAERGTPIINFWYMDGGSVQRIQATSTVLL